MYLVFLIWDAYSEPRRFLPLIGYLLILLFGFVFCRHPGYIRARPVFTGIILQLYFGILTLKTKYVTSFFKIVAGKVTEVLKFSAEGAGFAYGGMLTAEFTLAFLGMAIVFYISFMCSILYHLGILQRIVKCAGSFFMCIFGTTIIESLNAVCAIFMSMAETPVLFRPYLPFLTKSEIHAVMTNSFVSVAGSIFGIFIGYGASSVILLSACILGKVTGVFTPVTNNSMYKNDEMFRLDLHSLLQTCSKVVFNGFS